MARAVLTPVLSSASGSVYSAPGAVDAGNGNEFANAGRTMIEIVNGSASAVSATFVTNGTYSVGSTAYAIADLVVAVAASATKVCGPFDTTLFNSGTSTVQVDWSHGTSITARCVTMGTS
jgi:hypothetical protein